MNLRATLLALMLGLGVFGTAAVAASEPRSGAFDPANKQKPDDAQDDLERKARALFSAVQTDDPSVAKDFFFPREPFLMLKDIKNPGKYWDQLFRVYERDIHELHRKHKPWLDGAVFERIDLGSKPTWVKPGEEANKVGYYRTFNAKLRYRSREIVRTMEIKVLISWQGKWTVTHLLPFKKR